MMNTINRDQNGLEAEIEFYKKEFKLVKMEQYAKLRELQNDLREVSKKEEFERRGYEALRDTVAEEKKRIDLLKKSDTKTKVEI